MRSLRRFPWLLLLGFPLLPHTTAGSQPSDPPPAEADPAPQEDTPEEEAPKRSLLTSLHDLQATLANLEQLTDKASEDYDHQKEELEELYLDLHLTLFWVRVATKAVVAWVCLTLVAGGTYLAFHW